MNKIYFFVALMLVSLTIACSSDTNRSNNTNPNNTNPPVTSNQPVPQADNTARNERDRSDQTLTPTDQQENSADIEITQKIRKTVVDDKDLSMNAKNVKIITANQVVTLRGVVESSAEKDKVAGIAHQVAGVKNVNNQLEVIKQATDKEK